MTIRQYTTLLLSKQRRPQPSSKQQYTSTQIDKRIIPTASSKHAQSELQDVN